MNTPKISTLSRYPVTLLLIVSNAIIFITYGFDELTTLNLLDLGANFAPFTLDTEPHRLFTSMFLHGSFIHLAANMYGLYVAGSEVEYKTGSLHMLMIYLITGLIAGISSLIFNLFAISVGASGAILGIYGYLVAMTIRETPDNWFSITANFIIYLIIIFVIGTYMNFDNPGHLGGALSGLLIGLFMHHINRWLLYGLALATILTCFIYVPRYQADYYQAYQTFLAIDKKIVDTMGSQVSDRQLRDSLRTVLTLPDSAIGRFRSISYIPSELMQDTTSIIGFTKLRKQHLHYLDLLFSKESYIYMDSIEYVRARFSNIHPVEYSLNLNASPPPPQKAKEGSNEKLTPKRQYYDNDWLPSDSLSYSYYRTGQIDSVGDWHGKVFDFYRNGAIQMKGTYKRGLKNGIFLYYGPDSTYQSAGRYSRDYSVGKWEDYHKNGTLASEIRYEKGGSYLENSWDSLGNPVIIDRNGEINLYHPNGQVSLRRTILNGLEHGFTESFDENGNLLYKEYYENGELIRGMAFDGTIQSTYDINTYRPYPTGGFDAFNEYLQKNISDRSSDSEDRVVIRFEVNSDGTLHNLRFTKRISPAADSLARSLLLNGPKWKPAMSRGLYPINATTEVVIPF